MTALFDGVLKSEFSAYHHTSPDALRAALGPAATAEAPFTDSSCFLVETSEGLALIDAGSGPHLDATAGRLEGHLRDLGIAHEAIGFVIMSHLHADHVGGLVDRDGARMFPKARMLLHAEEAAYWSRAEPGAAGDHHPADLTGLALKAYGETATTFTDGAEILPGITAIHLPGHTPGHSGFLIGQGARRLFIWGDVVHLPEVQLAHPEITTIYDHDPAGAEASRRRAFAMAADNGLTVAGMHLRQPPFVRLERRASGYAHHGVGQTGTT
ncbi:MBL fold metallo-hydrolase [Devosia enhydra]|uniref:MBL fold metallo-hydrolase n=1 Tax=Devosia enhydra TaxID=665118 RepID=UPI0009301A5F|nr:MBL fold metallo-hydrolase [Devosia enhydra]